MIIAPENMLDRLLRIHELATTEYITEQWNMIPRSVQRLFVAASFYSDEEIAFVFAYTRFYNDSRRKPIAEQLFWTVKYAFAIAPVVTTLINTGSMGIKDVGGLIEYAFNSVREQFKPDVSSYDPDVIRGSAVARLLGSSYTLGPDSQLARDLGRSWELAAKHWDKLKDNDAEYAQAFLHNIGQGGSVHLADGII